MHDGRGNVGGAVGHSGVPPVKFPVLQIEPDRAVGCEDHHLARASYLVGPRRRVACRIALRFPEQRSSGFLERDDPRTWAAGWDTHAVAIHQERFADAPGWDTATEFIPAVQAPT